MNKPFGLTTEIRNNKDTRKQWNYIKKLRKEWDKDKVDYKLCNENDRFLNY